MRRTIALFTAMAMMVLVATSVAMAAHEITCNSKNVCYGTNGDDYLKGSIDHDTILAKYGNDSLVGGSGNDWMEGESGNDRLYGGDGRDFYSGGPNSDVMSDQSKTSGDYYSGFSSPIGYDRVYDYGGTDDVLSFLHLYRFQVRITWVDTSDADVNRDALRIQELGTTNSVLVHNYFNNLGGTDRGVGAIETIKFKGDILAPENPGVIAQG